VTLWQCEKGASSPISREELRLLCLRAIGALKTAVRVLKIGGIAAPGKLHVKTVSPLAFGFTIFSFSVGCHFLAFFRVFSGDIGF